MRYRRDRNWLTREDDWPEALPRVFQEVWHDVARIRRGEGMVTDSRNKCYAPMRYKFSENVRMYRVLLPVLLEVMRSVWSDENIMLYSPSPITMTIPKW